ncbi:MAG: mechanosensitive ion channel family protein [Alphaproteobacteria bacterium]|nr:mechanosensitive ion channel family protein [Alphaproteobacteria bacterium]
MTEIEHFSEAVSTWFSWAPAWLVASALYAACLGLALILHRLAHGFLARLVADRGLFWRSLVSRTRTVGQLGMLCLGLSVATSLAPLEAAGLDIAGRIFLIGLIGVATLGARTALHIWTTLHLRRFKLDADDNLTARQHVTQVKILRRTADTILVVIGIAAMLMTFDAVRQYGISLLASAGAAGLVVGLALQPLLKNLFAGIQLALTQPIRIDDVLVVEGEWGRVEEISSTYVVVRIWDLRRLIVPLSHFIEQPIENWTREGSQIIGAVPLYLDYKAPVDVIRNKARELVEGSKLWDGQVFGVQVTDASPSTITVRTIASSRNSTDAWDLRCMLREKLVEFLQDEYPDALPRTRSVVVGRPANDTIAALAGAGAEQLGGGE